MGWVSYRNGNYNVVLNTVDGTKVRYTEDDVFDAVSPESMDIKITDRCDMGCPWCHEDSTPDGRHAEIHQPFLGTLPPYREIAVGGGNVLAHPDLEDFLAHLTGIECIPSITVSQHHFLRNLDYLEDLRGRGLVFGIGVSYSHYSRELIDAMHRFPTSVLHVIAGVVDEHDIGLLGGNGIKLLVLGYKNFRRGASYADSHGGTVRRNLDYLGSNLKSLYGMFDRVAFDNLALEQLDVRGSVSSEVWDRHYMGDDGQHTFYIDMVEGKYAVSSSSDVRFDIGDKSIDEMFLHVKSLGK